MTDTTQVITAVDALDGISLGMVLGAIGQGVRAMVGLKKAADAAGANGHTLKDEFDASRLVVSLMIGAIAGTLAILPQLDQLGNVSLQLLVGLLAAGYAGTDFIESFMSKALPKLPQLDREFVSQQISAVLASRQVIHKVVASSFADPADVKAFKECKAQGKSDDECFKVGDNGIGFMGDDCTGPTPMCALPVEDWMERWGSKEKARLKPVLVSANGTSVTCFMGDTMPHRSDIKNGAGIDLSPAAVAALGLKPPIMVEATWQWADSDFMIS